MVECWRKGEGVEEESVEESGGGVWSEGGSVRKCGGRRVE